MMRKLAIITTHPIQYNAPLFKLLTERQIINLKVFYTWSQSQNPKIYDPGFGRLREWDIPLLEGYDYEFVKNNAKHPGSHHFWGIINSCLLKKINAYNPDMILVYGWSFYSHIRTIIYFKNKIPLLFRGDSTLLDDSSISPIKRYLRKITLSYIYRQVDKAFYVGHANKQYFLSNGLQENQLTFAPHAIDNNRFNENNEFYEKEALIWRRELGIPDESFVFLFAGKLEHKKNPLILIDAFQSLPDKKIRLIILGNGLLESEVKERSKFDKRIILLEFQNQSKMPIVYRLANVFVLPSSGPGETWGLSVNESMACGRPAIVSDVCGCCADLVIDGSTGYSFKSNNLVDLKRSMEKFLERNDIDKFKTSAQSHVSGYNLEVVAAAIENEIITTK